MNHSAGTFPSVIAVLPAAGIGSRMQAECPKQYLTIGRHSIVEHAIHALLRHPRIERVIVAIGPEDRQFERLPIAQDPRVTVTEGGKQRADSVMARLKLAGDADWVLEHDAARPCLHADDLERLHQRHAGGHHRRHLAAEDRDVLAFDLAAAA